MRGFRMFYTNLVFRVALASNVFFSLTNSAKFSLGKKKKLFVWIILLTLWSAWDIMSNYLRLLFLGDRKLQWYIQNILNGLFYFSIVH